MKKLIEKWINEAEKEKERAAVCSKTETPASAGLYSSNIHDERAITLFECAEELKSLQQKLLKICDEPLFFERSGGC